MHAAPEVLTSSRYDAKLADIWSAGVMLYTMLCCSYPFEKKDDDPNDLRTQTKIMQRIMKGTSPSCHPRLMMQKCCCLTKSAIKVLCCPTQCRLCMASIGSVWYNSRSWPFWLFTRNNPV